MNIDNILAGAQRLMLDEEWNRQVEMGAAAQRAGSMNGRSNGGSDLAALEAAAFGNPVSESTNYYTPIPSDAKIKSGAMITDSGKPIQMLKETKQEFNPATSKLPKAILESFASLPPLSGDDDFSEVPSSFLGGQVRQQQPQHKQVIKEIAQPQYQPSASPQIDYQYIKHLIDESIKEHMKSTLNENANLSNFRAMRIAEGNVFQFIDSKGNLYEGVLKLKKKAQK